MIFLKKKAFLFATLFLFFILPQNTESSGFGIKPANPKPENPRTQSIFIHTIDSGESINDGVKIINNNRDPRSVLLYSRDSVRSSGGGFACMQMSETSVGVGKWISFDISNIENEIQEKIKISNISNAIEVEIPGGSEITIPFTINTPKDASVGEHNGCILIQEIKEKSESAGVSLSMRSGTRVIINTPGEIFRKLEVENFIIKKTKKAIHLKPSVKNIGNVSIDANISVLVKNFLGINHKKFGGDFPVLRNEIYDFNFELKKPFWGGLYFTKAIFEYDAGEGASVGIKSGEEITKLKSKKIWFFSFPTIFGLILEIIILLFIIFIVAIWRLNKKKKAWIKKWVEYKIEEGETLETISKKFRVHWEIIAEVNKIAPPFILKQGNKILVPPRKIIK